jgi:hypothetical protein
MVAHANLPNRDPGGIAPPDRYTSFSFVISCLGNGGETGKRVLVHVGQDQIPR